jgi:hypothetical protein
MAHKRKDTPVAAPEWWPHLRPYNKRRVAKKERRAANRLIQDTGENQVHPKEILGAQILRLRPLQTVDAR